MEQLQQKAQMHRSIMPNAEFVFAEWLLEHGEEFGPSIKRSGKNQRLRTIKQCYSNSLQALMPFGGNFNRDEWFYTEGVVVRKDIPFLEIDHAWLSNRKGEVLDLTLRHQDPEDKYFGVPFTYDYAVEKTMEHGYYGLFSNGIIYNQDVMESVDEGRAWPKGER
jgi:hypothetical protein